MSDAYDIETHSCHVQQHSRSRYYASLTGNRSHRTVVRSYSAMCITAAEHAAPCAMHRTTQHTVGTLSVADACVLAT